MKPRPKFIIWLAQTNRSTLEDFERGATYALFKRIVPRTLPTYD